MKDFPAIIRSGKFLTEEQMVEAITAIIENSYAEDEVADFLLVLAARGETPEEIAGAARAMRTRAETITAPPGTVDCCGTGGDASGTYNISTAVALVAAGCGVPVAKHGNRASSSKSGAADVLEKLGVNLSLSTSALEQSLRETGFAFLMAPNHHKAMKQVAPIRKKLGTKTIFNLLGPLSNPAGAKLQLVGVYDRKWIMPMAEALKKLGAERAWVVHGSDGLDEITITGPTFVAVLDNGKITEREIVPADFWLPTRNAAELRGGDAAHNAQALRELLNGKKSAYRDIVLANTAAVLNIHGSSQDLVHAVNRAAAAIDNGLAARTLQAYTEFSKQHGQA